MWYASEENVQMGVEPVREVRLRCKGSAMLQQNAKDHQDEKGIAPGSFVVDREDQGIRFRTFRSKIATEHRLKGAGWIAS